MHSAPLLALLFFLAAHTCHGKREGVYLERDASNEGVYLEPEQGDERRTLMEELEMEAREMQEGQLEERELDMHDTANLLDTFLSSGPGGCKREGEQCHGFPKCCGKLVCYWEGKFNPLEQGTCVKCVKEGQRCVRDNQCCNGLQCDKNSRFYLNGWCRPPRPEGAKCHTDSMCNAYCQKGGWFNIYGTCMG